MPTISGGAFFKPVAPIPAGASGTAGIGSTFSPSLRELGFQSLNKKLGEISARLDQLAGLANRLPPPGDDKESVRFLSDLSESRQNLDSVPMNEVPERLKPIANIVREMRRLEASIEQVREDLVLIPLAASGGGWTQQQERQAVTAFEKTYDQTVDKGWRLMRDLADRFNLPLNLGVGE